ncbi:MAG: TonB-dependent receptor [Parvibaculales bacterium]
MGIEKIKTKFKTHSGVLALSAAIVMTPFAAHAQLDEIIVTAQKREQNLQDVPVAVTAISSDYIESRNITSIENLSSLAPNLKIERSPNNTTAAQISIRGGVTINPAISWEPTTGIYLNGVYIGKTQGSVFDVAEIERIEVLRGPQGSLYGRNTLAGAVNIITAQPSDESGVKAEVGFGNYNLRTARLTVDSGQVGKFRVKASGMIKERDGLVDTTAGSSTNEFENIDRKSFLLAVNYEASDDLTVDYTYDYSDVDQKPAFSQLVKTLDGGIFDPASPFYAQIPLRNFQSSDRLSIGSSDGSIGGRVFELSEVTGHGLTFTYDMGDMTFKSITGYREMTWADSLDLDGSPLFLAHTQRFSDYESMSQEFQLVGSNDRLNYVVGAYYFEDDAYTNNPQQFFFGASNYDSQYGVETEAMAVYGQLDYAVTDQVTVTAGLRYTEEDKSVERLFRIIADSTVPANFLPLTVIPATTKATETFDDMSPTLSVDYKASEDITLYAKYSKGFKSGGFNGEAGSVAETIRPYQAEEVASIELGAKMQLLDNRLQLNTAIFSNEHEDMQLSIFTAQGAAQSDVRNAGKAQIQGFELEAAYAMSERVVGRLNYGYLDTEYDEFIEFGQQVADNRAFPHAPRHTLSAGIDATLMDNENGTLDLGLDANHVGEYFTYPYALRPAGTENNAYNTLVASRTLLNAQLTWSNLPIAGQNVSVTFWGKNIGDKEYIANYIDFGAAFGGLTPGYFGEPRTYGMTIRAKW